MNYLKQELYQLIKRDDSVFDFMQESALDGLWYWDLEKPENAWMNPKFWHTLGYVPEKMPHKVDVWKNIIHPEDLKIATENFIKHCEDQEHPYDQIVRYRHKNGSTVRIRCSGLAVRDENGKAVRILGAHADITKQKLKEQELERQLQRYNSIIMGTDIGTWEWNVETGETTFSERWADMLGYTISELSPTNFETWAKLLHPDDLEKSKKQLDKHFKGEIDLYEVEIRMKHKQGHWIWILGRGRVATWLENGQPHWVYGSHIDITARKKNELLLEEYQQLFQKTSEAAQIGRWEVDLVNDTVFWDETTRAIHEIDDNYVPNVKDGIAFYQEGHDRDAIIKAFNNCIENGIKYDLELKIITAKGRKKWVRAIGLPYFEEEGKCARTYGLFQDINRQKRIQENLSKQKEQFQKTFEYSANGMAIVKPDGTFFQVNKNLCNIVGYSKEELAQLTFQDITHPDDLKADLDLLNELIEGKRDYYKIEKRYSHKDGSIIWVLLAVSMIKNDQEKPKHFISQITDITNQKKAEDRLQGTLSRLEGILNASTQVSIITTRNEGTITSFNKGAENLLGYKAKELIGAHTPEIIHVPEEVEAHRKKLSEKYLKKITPFEALIYEAKKGNHETREWNYVRKDGTLFPVQLTVTAIKERGEIVGYLGVATDISQLKKVEKEQKNLLHLTKEQNQRLINFAHIVSHNLRSHAGNFSMILDILENETDPDTIQEFNDMLKEASIKLNETVDNLNEVVQMNTQTPRSLKKEQLLPYIVSTQHNLSGLIKETKANINIDVGEDVYVRAVPAYLDSIFLNFISNAIKYRSPERTPEIDIKAKRVDKYWEINIQDNGKGIDMDKYGDKLFGMYKTFHGNEDARGIGLFITKNQIESMGGSIAVESEVGKGTLFKIYLYGEN